MHVQGESAALSTARQPALHMIRFDRHLWSRFRRIAAPYWFGEEKWPARRRLTRDFLGDYFSDRAYYELKRIFP